MGHNDIAKLLLDKNANVNAVISQNGNTPLHLAVIGGNTILYTRNMVRLLLNAGADSLIQNHDHETALDLAKKSRNQPIIEIFRIHSIKQKAEILGDMDNGEP
jgi:ankyrin repeat protein